MKNLLEPTTIANLRGSTSKPRIHALLSLFLWILVCCAFVAGLLVLVSDLFWQFLPHAPLSAAPLLLIGAAYLGFQVLARPKLLDLLKAFMISSAFLLWGIDQILSPGWLVTTLGDVVITLYVLDLGWIMLDHLIQRKAQK